MESRQAGLPTLNHLLQHTLRSLCSTDSQWLYAVFWRIRPRNYPPPQLRYMWVDCGGCTYHRWEKEGGAADRSKGNKRNWILVWEDGFCNFSVCLGVGAATNQAATSSESPFLGQQQRSIGVTSCCCAVEQESEAMNPELFFKMSHEVYNYGEGLMGKVAADNSHKWVYREPLEHGNNGLSSPWHGSIDPHPRTWEAQFKAGIQTVAVVAVQEGLLQLGSTFKIAEDLNFVILMQRKFNYLQSIPGVFVPQPIPATNGSSKRPVQYEGLEAAEFPPVPEPDQVWAGNWIMSPEADHQTRLTSYSNAFSSRAVDQFMSSSRTGMFGPQSASLHNSGSILGMKRPPAEMHVTPELLPFHSLPDYPSYGSSVGKVRSYAAACRSEYPNFAPQTPLNASLESGCRTGSLPNQLLPSMSSLQALLSKLPSVAPKELESNYICSLQRRADSPPLPQLRSDSSPTASNYSSCSPAAASSPMCQTNKTSPMKCPGSVSGSLSSSYQLDHHLSSPDHLNPNVAEQSDSRPRCCTLNTLRPASDQSLSCNSNGSNAERPVTTIISEPFNTLDGSADNSCSAAAASTAPMLSASITSDQRLHNQFGGVYSDLRTVGNVYDQFRDQTIAPAGLIKDKVQLMSSNKSLDHRHPPDNIPDALDNFGLQESAPENNIDNYNSIFSEIY